MEVRRGVAAVPVDPRGEALDAVALHAIGLPLLQHPDVARAAREHDPALRGRRRIRHSTRSDEREKALRKPIDTLPGRRGDRDGLAAARGERLHEGGHVVASLGQVDLVQGDKLGPLTETVAVRVELAVDRGDVRERVLARRVDDMDDEARPLDVAQELLAESRALARALDEAGDVSDDELPLVEPRDTQVRRERRERIRRDLRPRAGQRREQARLPGVGQTGEPDVGDEPQLELELALLAALAVHRDARRAPRARDETRVAASALAAAGSDDLRAVDSEIGDLL